ncbi:MAG: 3-oxoadipate enol-lactonase [Paracoccaceae bacterium]|nr:3-oxoadipate enol-lactonase [Paracoccaceae bacterium]
MQTVKLNDVTLHVAETGPADGPALVFSNSLGTDFRIWDAVLPRLPRGLHIVRYDKRGHGLSDCPKAPWDMSDHVADLSGILDALGVSGAVVCGLSVGGIIAQGLAAERPDLVTALILCDTGAKIGNPELWDGRIAAVEEGGIEVIADGVMERWFTSAFREGDPSFPVWRNMLSRTPAAGYARTSAAIRDTDLIESTSRLRLPCLAICGAEDGATPPDLVRETAGLIPGSRFELIRKAGHLPCIEQPGETARLIGDFLAGIGHV